MQKAKVNEAIDVIYQPAKAISGITDATMQIYDETGALDPVNFADVTMTEIGVTGRYRGTFTPDVTGDWVVMMHYGADKNPAVEQYRVTDYDVDDAVEAAGDPTIVA